MNNFKKKYYENKRLTDRLLIDLPIYFKKYCPDEKIYNEIEDKLIELNICDCDYICEDCLKIKDRIYELILEVVDRFRGAVECNNTKTNLLDPILSYFMDESSIDINFESVYTMSNEKSSPDFKNSPYWIVVI